MCGPTSLGHGLSKEILARVPPQFGMHTIFVIFKRHPWGYKEALCKNLETVLAPKWQYKINIKQRWKYQNGFLRFGNS